VRKCVNRPPVGVLLHALERAHHLLLRLHHQAVFCDDDAAVRPHLRSKQLQQLSNVDILAAAAAAADDDDGNDDDDNNDGNDDVFFKSVACCTPSYLSPMRVAHLLHIS